MYICICWATEADRRDIVTMTETPVVEVEICVSAYCSVLYSAAYMCSQLHPFHTSKLRQNLGTRLMNPPHVGFVG